MSLSGLKRVARSAVKKNLYTDKISEYPDTMQNAPGPAKPYHHGDLRSALLAAAEIELFDRGVEAFSLRQVAKRAGVSHAAPAHHFGDTGGLLTALAAEGYRAFQKTLDDRMAQAGDDPRARQMAAGLGYISFATIRPALFRLIFGSDRINFADPDLVAASSHAYSRLEQGVFAISADAGPVDVVAVWAMVHGLADLMVGHRLHGLQDLPPDQRNAALRQILARSLP